MDEYGDGLLTMIGTIIIVAVIIFLVIKLCVKFTKFLKKKQEERRQAEKDMWRHTDTPIDD